MEYDAIIIGAGPAGLTVASELASKTWRVLVLEAESPGGTVLNVEWIHDYPRSGEKIAGPMLASELVNRAQAAGVETQIARVSEIEVYSGCISVTRTDGVAHTSSVLVLAGGLQSKPLGVPGEARFHGKGMIHCAMCDASLYRDRVVAVCGAGDAGMIEALYLARFCSKVYVFEKNASPSANSSVLKKAMKEPKIELRCLVEPVEVVGDETVTGIIVEQTDGKREELGVYGVLVHIGYEPTTDYLQGILSLDPIKLVIANERLETSVSRIFAAGDLRNGSPRSVAAAISDGKVVAKAAMEFLRA